MNDKWYLVDNEMGLFIRASREAKEYSMQEISHGICSIPTLSRIEAGERVVDYIMIEALLERMKLAKSEYEFVLDEEDYFQYMQREDIRKLITLKNYKKAEDKLLEYEKEHGNKFLHVMDGVFSVVSAPVFSKVRVGSKLYIPEFYSYVKLFI